MDKQERDNWRKVKEGLEEAGMTDCVYYLRARVIANGGVDPISDYEPGGDEE